MCCFLGEAGFFSTRRGECLGDCGLEYQRGRGGRFGTTEVSNLLARIYPVFLFFSLQPFGRFQVTCVIADYIIASKIICIRVGQVS